MKVTARYSAHQILRQDADDPTLLRLQHGAEPAADDVAVGHLDDEHMAAFVCEAHNAYLPAMQGLFGLPHTDAIPARWRAGEGDPIGLRDIVRLLCEHLTPNSVGAPTPSTGGQGAST